MEEQDKLGPAPGLGRKGPGRPARVPGRGRTDAAPAPEVVAQAQARLRTETVARETIREPVRVDGRRRNRKGGQQQNPFDVPEHLKRPGLSYEWKRHTVMGKEDYSYTSSMLENGWLAVDAKDMPGFMRPGYDGPVVCDGMILMERPAELTQEAVREREADARDAMTVQKVKAGQAPDKTFTRDHPLVQKVTFNNSEYATAIEVDRSTGEPIPVADE